MVIMINICVCVCVGMIMGVWAPSPPCKCGVGRHLCGIRSLLPTSCRIWRLNSSCLACLTNAFTCCTTVLTGVGFLKPWVTSIGYLFPVSPFFFFFFNENTYNSKLCLFALAILYFHFHLVLGYFQSSLFCLFRSFLFIQAFV